MSKSSVILGLFLSVVLVIVVVCGEEEVFVKNQFFEWVAGSAKLSCVDAEVPDLDEKVLAGGEVQVIDDNLSWVRVEIGGLPSVLLERELMDAAEVDPKAPQRYFFTFDVERRVLCDKNLVLVFEARDEKGEQIVLSVRP